MIPIDLTGGGGLLVIGLPGRCLPCERSFRAAAGFQFNR